MAASAGVSQKNSTFKLSNTYRGFNTKLSTRLKIINPGNYQPPESSGPGWNQGLLHPPLLVEVIFNVQPHKGLYFVRMKVKEWGFAWGESRRSLLSRSNYQIIIFTGCIFTPRGLTVPCHLHARYYMYWLVYLIAFNPQSSYVIIIKHQSTFHVRFLSHSGDKHFDWGNGINK